MRLRSYRIAISHRRKPRGRTFTPSYVRCGDATRRRIAEWGDQRARPLHIVICDCDQIASQYSIGGNQGAEPLHPHMCDAMTRTRWWIAAWGDQRERPLHIAICDCNQITS